ncbi:alpha-glucosidase/alpha-galactosidase [Mobilitalea sibirica]|uniref:Alpha-glucosidase/alpha-galactosidase n=1 Tax=Mobilitalea sibirica TaxID=1462919 RepID=A0A8J7HB40_9FIRM|nr:alpha-glucosidase/alpha-galactosidase [Mobilitalea sibirica]MBH1939562.1 alpha-glucosidase/alpha-galactosidase [Mobilitalea sibirica]
MVKITFMGAGSTVFARNVLGDCMCTPSLWDAEIALYDIDPIRLSESEIILKAINKSINLNRAVIKTYLGVINRKEALRGANFVVNAIQVGFYDPCTITDFEIPKKYGLKQTIGDTLGIGGIMRGLRTIPVLKDFAREMEEVCPQALLLNYTNPMSILTGYMQRYTNVKTIGLCHSVQICSETLLKNLGMEDKLEGRSDLIAGINHMAWLLEIKDKEGNDLYPEIKFRAEQKNNTQKHNDMVRFEYIKRLGYYCTESSEHNAEYNPFFIKSKYPELIDRYQIPLDEYPRRCIKQIKGWENEKNSILQDGQITHQRSQEYASYIMEAIVTNKPIKIGGNVLNTGLIDNLPADACVEVPCLVDAQGIHPCHIGRLPVQLAAMNMTNINVQLMTIEAAITGRRDSIYQAAMMDPHTSAELSIDDIVSMCDELIDTHGDYMKEYR